MSVRTICLVIVGLALSSLLTQSVVGQTVDEEMKQFSGTWRSSNTGGWGGGLGGGPEMSAASGLTDKYRFAPDGTYVRFRAVGGPDGQVCEIFEIGNYKLDPQKLPKTIDLEYSCPRRYRKHPPSIDVKGWAFLPKGFQKPVGRTIDFDWASLKPFKYHSTRIGTYELNEGKLILNFGLFDQTVRPETFVRRSILVPDIRDKHMEERYGEMSGTWVANGDDSMDNLVGPKGEFRSRYEFTKDGKYTFEIIRPNGKRLVAVEQGTFDLYPEPPDYFPNDDKPKPIGPWGITLFPTTGKLKGYSRSGLYQFIESQLQFVIASDPYDPGPSELNPDYAFTYIKETSRTESEEKIDGKNDKP